MTRGRGVDAPRLVRGRGALAAMPPMLAEAARRAGRPRHRSRWGAPGDRDRPALGRAVCGYLKVKKILEAVRSMLALLVVSVRVAV